MSNPFRSLPAVHEVLAWPQVEELARRHSRALVAEAVRCEMDQLRSRLRAGEELDGQAAGTVLAAGIAQRLEREIRPRLRPVINATGILLHTNLGRAPMAETAAQAAADAARGYLNLEIDLETGKRSSRQEAVRGWLCRLTGAESATAVNNNAAATVLALKALAAGREVVVSRGQLVEIGGSFRIPEIMAASGAMLREVGTTNITRIRDYERAIRPGITAALLRVHTSNYRICGHVEAVEIEELVALGRQSGILVIDDIGSGALVDFHRWGLAGEPMTRHSLAAGADLVLLSGDKLLGGPQAGILAGRKELIDRIEAEPLMRAFRLDKMTLAALEATLRLYLDEARALADIPILRMLETPLAELRRRVGRMAGELVHCPGLRTIETQDGMAEVGGGSLPGQEISTVLLALEPGAITDAELARRLRTGDPAVLTRIQEGRVLLDARTILPDQDEACVAAIRQALAQA